MFQDHDPETLLRWVTTLRFVRFYRAIGGHANDGDEFRIGFLFTDPQTLTKFLKFFSFRTPPTQDTGAWGTIREIPLFVLVRETAVECIFAGAEGSSMYGVSEEDFQRAHAFEKLIEEFAWQTYLDPTIHPSPRCLTAEKIRRLASGYRVVRP